MSEQEFCERVLSDLQSEGNFSSTVDGALIVFDGTSVEMQSEKSNGNESIKKPGAKKRRANLTEFDESETTKRKNETAKRELTSIVKQVCNAHCNLLFLSTCQQNMLSVAFEN